MVIALVFKRSDIAFAELYMDHDTSGLPMNYLNFTMTVQLVQVGTAWSIGLRSTIGRTLEKMGACAVRVDPVRLEAAIAMLLPSLKNEIGALNQLDETTLRRFLLGLLHHLRQRGGILHSATQSYIEQNGQSYVLQRPLYMPGFGPSSRLPMYLSDKSSGRGGFEQIIKNKTTATWCYQWAFKSFFDWDALSLVAEQFPQLYQLTLDALVKSNLLDLRITRTNQSVWGLLQSALLVQAQATQLNCTSCHDSCMSVPEDLPYWENMPCLQPHCDGHYAPSSQQGFESGQTHTFLHTSPAVRLP